MDTGEWPSPTTPAWETALERLAYAASWQASLEQLASITEQIGFRAQEIEDAYALPEQLGNRAHLIADKLAAAHTLATELGRDLRKNAHQMLDIAAGLLDS